MKKFFVVSIILFSFFLSGCVHKDLIDIFLFSEKFSKYSENFEIDTSALIAENEKEEIIFPIIFSDKFLITVRANEKTSLISSVSVVYAYDEKNTLSDKDFLLLKELIESSVKAFTSNQNVNDIFENLSITKKGNITKNTHLHFEKDFYKYSLVSNEVGIYFSASTERQ